MKVIEETKRVCDVYMRDVYICDVSKSLGLFRQKTVFAKTSFANYSESGRAFHFPLSPPRLSHSFCFWDTQTLHSPLPFPLFLNLSKPNPSVTPLANAVIQLREEDVYA